MSTSISENFSTRLSYVKQSSGSARFCQGFSITYCLVTLLLPLGDSEVIVSVVGPTSAPVKKQKYDRLSIELKIVEKDPTYHFGATTGQSRYDAMQMSVMTILEACINTIDLPGALLLINVMVASDAGSV